MEKLTIVASMMVFTGFLAHHLIALLDMRIKGNVDADMFFYIQHRPIKLVLSLIGCFIGFVLVDLEFATLFDMAASADENSYAIREVTSKYYITMFLTGYMSDSVVDKAGSMTSQKIKI